MSLIRKRIYPDRHPKHIHGGKTTYPNRSYRYIPYGTRRRSYVSYLVPAGVIVTWTGTLATIPSGWALCDGTLGTPDLREVFLGGHSDGVDPGTTGGSLTTGTPSATVGVDGSVETITVASDSHTHDYIPPFYQVAFIMKL